MNDKKTNPDTGYKDEEAEDPRVNLALQRTELAMERTQLAWIRTTLTFLGSGIALDKGMEIIHQSRVLAGTALFQNTHATGIALSLGGTLLMIMSSWFCFKRFRNLARLKNGGTGLQPVLWASLLVILLGVTVSLLLLLT